MVGVRAVPYPTGKVKGPTYGLTGQSLGQGHAIMGYRHKLGEIAMFWDDESTKWNKALLKADAERRRREAMIANDEKRVRRIKSERDEEKRINALVGLRERADAILLEHGWMYDWRGWLIKVVKGVLFRIEYRDELIILAYRKENKTFKQVVKGQIETFKVVDGSLYIAERRIG